MTLLRRSMAELAVVGTILAVGAFLVLSGCAIPIEGNGEFGFRQSTSWGFYRSTEKADPADKSTISLDVSPAVDLLIKLEDAKSKPDTVADPAP